MDDATPGFAAAHARRKELLQAFVAAQAEFKPVRTTETVNTAKYSYKYADLAGVLEATLPALNKHGICLHYTYRLDGEWLIATCHAVHVLGEEISADAMVPAKGDGRLMGAQAMGSAMTFARRYATLAALGLASEDDDGAAAPSGGNSPASRPAPKPATRQNAAPQAEPRQADQPGEQIMDGILESVEQKTSKTGKEFSVLQLVGGWNASSWSHQMNSAAADMVGKPVSITFTSKVVGDQTYHNAQNIELAGGGDGMPQDNPAGGTEIEHDVVIADFTMMGRGWAKITAASGSVYYTENAVYIQELQKAFAANATTTVSSRKNNRGQSIIDHIDYPGGDDTPF